MEIKLIELEERFGGQASGYGAGKPESFNWQKNVRFGSQIKLRHRGQDFSVLLQRSVPNGRFVGKVDLVPSHSFPVAGRGLN